MKYLITFDVETTGVDPHNDRIVTAFVGALKQSGEWIKTRSWLINPGVPIPEGASAIHGITNEMAQADGVDAPAAISEICETLRVALTTGHPLVVYNAAFDLTMIREEASRYGLPVPEFHRVIDPLVIDKAIDKYRKGSRKLVDVCAIRGITVEENAHDAGADCLMAGKLAWKLLEKFPEGVDELHRFQIDWRVEQAWSLQAYLRKTNPDAVVDPSWPYPEL